MGAKDIARAFQGFGAGVAGRGEQFLSGIREEERQLSDERKQAFLSDSFSVMRSLQNNQPGRAREILTDRIGAVTELGGDPSDAVGLLAKMDAGDYAGALVDVTTVVEFAQANKELLPEGAGVAPEHKIVDGQLVTIDQGQASAADIEGFRRDPGKQRDRELRERSISVQERAQERLDTKLSAGLESALLAAQDRTVEAQRNANEFDVLAGDFERLNLEGGLASTVSETFKGILGTQDDVTEFRRRFNKVRLSEGLKNLPPGPATDRDVKEAFKGVPKESASAEQVASFLRGAARLARFEAGYNQFKSDFISGRSGTKGLNQMWRKKVISGKLDRNVTIAELYETAQNRGISPEDVATQLGIDMGLF